MLGQRDSQRRLCKRFGRPEDGRVLLRVGARAFLIAEPLDHAYRHAHVGKKPHSLPYDAFFQEKFPQAKNICSAVPEYSGNKKPEAYSNWSDAVDIDITIVRSPLAVAETGSVLLTENELHVNTIGFLAHDIVILLDPKDVVENIHDAYQHRALTSRYLSFA